MKLSTSPASDVDSYFPLALRVPTTELVAGVSIFLPLNGRRGKVRFSSFALALYRADDSSALSLLESCLVTSNSLTPYELQGHRELTPVIFLAVKLVREHVARALVHLGADIDARRNDSDRVVTTPAGAAIIEGNVSGLALCVNLGASMSLVSRLPRIMDYSAAMCAITWPRPSCLEYLLDNVYQTRPIELNILEVASLSGKAIKGGDMKPIYKILAARGFNFKHFEEAEFGSAAQGRVNLADFMLKGAQESGDAELMRYIVKDLGLVSSGKQQEASEGHIKRLLPICGKAGAKLLKYECASCDVVCATKICAGCRVARYCSKECSRRHWKTGGHKKECKELQCAAALSKSGSTGSSHS